MIVRQGVKQRNFFSSLNSFLRGIEPLTDLRLSGSDALPLSYKDSMRVSYQANPNFKC